ncbi:unnamed protein product, partial [Rotaria sp. Silwood1]
RKYSEDTEGAIQSGPPDISPLRDVAFSAYDAAFPRKD